MALAVVTLGSRQCCWNLALAVSEQRCYFNSFSALVMLPLSETGPLPADIQLPVDITVYKKRKSSDHN